MPLFQKTYPHILGIDVGTSSIKVIELAPTETGKYQLATYGFMEDFDHENRTVGKEDASRIAETVKLIVKKAGTTTSRATGALPTYLVFTSLISLPHMHEDELDSAIHWEAKKIIPLPIEDIILDYKVLNPHKPEAKGLFKKKENETAADVAQEKEDIKVLVTGAAKETVQMYSDIFKKSGLTLVSLETEMFALARSLVGDDPEEIMIVEIGSAITDIILVQDGVPFLGRSIETGGSALTHAIMKSLNINMKRAEQLKRDIGITGFDDPAAGGVPAILKETLEPIVHEIKYTLDIYKNHAVTPTSRASGVVQKIILTGGTSLMPHLVDYFSKALDMRVLLGDPWAHIEYPADLKPVLSTLGPKFSVAIGLAMR